MARRHRITEEITMRYRILIEIESVSRDKINDCALRLGIAAQEAGEVVLITTEIVDEEKSTLKRKR